MFTAALTQFQSLIDTHNSASAIKNIQPVVLILTSNVLSRLSLPTIPEDTPLKVLLEGWVQAGASAVHAPPSAVHAIYQTVCSRVRVTDVPAWSVPAELKEGGDGFEKTVAELAACARFALLLLRVLEHADDSIDSENSDGDDAGM